MRVVKSLGGDRVDGGRYVHFSGSIETREVVPLVTPETQGTTCYTWAQLVKQVVNIALVEDLSEDLQARVDLLDGLVDENGLGVDHRVVQL